MRQFAVAATCVGVMVATMSSCSRSTPSTTSASPLPSPPAAASDMSDMAHLPLTLADWSKGAVLYEGLGDFHRKITTDSAEAQQYFDQGMRFLWAFNHDESTRSFAKAVQVDPQSAPTTTFR
jgi:hypothetical protein